MGSLGYGAEDALGDVVMSAAEGQVSFLEPAKPLGVTVIKDMMQFRCVNTWRVTDCRD